MTQASELPAWFLNSDEEGIQEWIATRPLVVKALLTEFPFGTIVEIQNEKWFVFGATDTGMLIITPISSTSYDEAVMRREHLCPDHVRTKH